MNALLPQFPSKTAYIGAKRSEEAFSEQFYRDNEGFPILRTAGILRYANSCHYISQVPRHQQKTECVRSVQLDSITMNCSLFK